MRPAASATLLGVVLALAAATFDTPSLYVPGVALTALATVSAAWVWAAARGASVRGAAGPKTVMEDEPYPLRVELRGGLLPPPAAELRHPLLPAPLRLGRGAGRGVEVELSFPRRGRRRLPRGALLVHDPLWLAVRELPVGEGDELLVLPRVEPVLVGDAGGGAAAGPGQLGHGGDRAGWSGRGGGSAAELDLDGLRPYRPGTPASRIHWPALARSGEMLERRLTAEADAAPLVVLDASRPPSEESLDRAVRAAGSLCLHLARRGGCSLLLPGDRRPTAVGSDLAGWPALHARLALVEACSRRPPAALARNAGAVLWVSASGSAPGEVLRGIGAVTWLVSAGPATAPRPELTVAGCAGRRLGRAGAARRAGVAV